MAKIISKLKKINKPAVSSNTQPENSQVKFFIWGSIGLIIFVVVFFIGLIVFLFSSPSDKSSKIDDSSLINNQDSDLETADMFVTKAPSEPILTAPTVSFIDPQIGPKDAPVTIVEFSDFNCPYCAEVQSTLSDLLKLYPEKIRLVFKNLPIPKLHPSAPLAAQAALCANRQNKFWQYHDMLFANQDYFSQDVLVGFAKDLKLDTDSFSSCLENKETVPLVDKSVKEASQLKIDGTPHFYINDQELSGAATLEEFIQLVEIELGKK